MSVLMFQFKTVKTKGETGIVEDDTIQEYLEGFTDIIKEIKRSLANIGKDI